MPYNELFDWRMQHYPSTYEGDNAITDYDINLELSEVLNNWYLESHVVKIPFYQYTNEEFDFSSYWERRSTGYSTKIPDGEYEKLKPTKILVRYQAWFTTCRFSIRLLGIRRQGG